MDIFEIEDDTALRTQSDHATHVLEAGGVVILPRKPFSLTPIEQTLLDPAISNGRSKNVSLDPSTGEIGGVDVDAARRATLKAMIQRFARTADALLTEVTPHYGPALQRRRTSFRPGAITDRPLSPRKDDRRLHVDAFPANPVQGRRILRVFANVNPDGESRRWDVGEEDFEVTAGRFRPHLKSRPSFAKIKAALGVTKGRQTGYDQVMLQIHDRAKLDEHYQASAPRRRLEFQAGSMWIVYTDAVSHAALSGQYAFEQTYLLNPSAMMEEEVSPLRALERLLDRALV